MALGIPSLVQSKSSYDSSEGVEAEGHLLQVPPLKEVGGLEDLLVGNSILPDGILKPGTKSRVTDQG